MNQRQTLTVQTRQTSEKTESVYDDGCLRVEHKNYYAAVGGEKLRLARAEFLIISILTQNIRRHLSAEVIWRHLWAETKPLNTKSLRVFIHHIRRRLAPFGIRIESVTSMGYRLVSPKLAN